MVKRRVGLIAGKSRFNLVSALSIVAAIQIAAFSMVDTARAQSFQESLATTYANNPTIRAARANLRAIDEGVPQALSGWRPNLAANADVGYQYTDTESQFFSDKGDSQPRGLDLNVTQSIYSGGRTVSETKGAELDVLAGRADLSSVEQDTLFEASVAYLDVWLDQSVLTLNINNEQVLQRQLEASQDRFEVGEITRTDVAQSEARLARATADRIASEGRLRSSRAVFQRVVGVYPTDLSPAPELGEMPAGLDDLVEISLAQEPRVISAQFREQSARENVRTVEGEFLPSAQLRGRLSYVDDQGIAETETSEALVIAELSIPLYQQGLVSSRTREAKQIAFRARTELDETLDQVREDAIEAWEALVTAQAQIRSFEVEVSASQIALEGVREENTVGERTVLDVLDAEQELLDAQVALVRAQRDGLVSNYAVLQAMGILTAEALELSVDLYDDSKNYNRVRDQWFGTDISIEEE